MQLGRRRRSTGSPAPSRRQSTDVEGRRKGTGCEAGSATSASSPPGPRPKREAWRKRRIARWRRKSFPQPSMSGRATPTYTGPQRCFSWWRPTMGPCFSPEKRRGHLRGGGSLSPRGRFWIPPQSQSELSRTSRGDRDPSGRGPPPRTRRRPGRRRRSSRARAAEHGDARPGAVEGDAGEPCRPPSCADSRSPPVEHAAIGLLRGRRRDAGQGGGARRGVPQDRGSRCGPGDRKLCDLAMCV